jgi:hypothetical protein
MRPLAVTFAALALVAGCGGGGNSAEPPLGLGTVTYPASGDEVRRLLAELPESIAPAGGDPLERSEEDSRPLLAAYGDEEGYVRAQTTQVAPAQLLAEVVEGETIGVESSEVSEDAEVVYVLGESVAAGRNAYLASWAARGSLWLYSAQAFTREGRDALVRAFVAAAQG